MRAKINMELVERSLSKKLMVYLVKSWTTVKDLEYHLKRLFNLGDDQQLEFYVNDFWIPSSENIDILSPFDELLVKEVPASNDSSTKKVTPPRKTNKSKTRAEEAFHEERGVTDENNCSPTNNEAPSRKVKKPNTEEQVDVNSVCVVKDELSLRKEQLLSEISFEEESKMDVTDCHKPKRKRKRKHKSSNPKLHIQISQDESFSSPKPHSQASGENGGVEILRPGHIRFDDNCDADVADVEYQDEKKLEDWQENLLLLAQERKKKVFSRLPMTNGHNGELHQETNNLPPNGSPTTVESPDCVSTVSVPMETPKNSDLIYFKKLVMKNFIPTVSDFMLAIVEEIEGDNLLTLKICKGHDDETFTAEELQESEGESFIVKLPMSGILEPRVVTDQTLLSKYL